LRDNIGRHIPRYPCDTPAYNLQDEYQLDTVDANLLLGFAADLRDYGVAAQILKMLDVHQIDLITNNPQKVRDLRTHGIEVVSVIPSEVTVTEDNARYLQTKRDRLGHLFRDTGPGRVDRRIKRS
jgi:3,4-dihydroxy 2-butanone 4-phosphate synthase/GTP cyclohydrolase II